MLRLFVLMAVLSSAQEEDDPLQFFEEEGTVVTASLRSQPARLAVANVHVITGEEAQRSGAQTLWDALRLAPGVDVMTIHPLHGVASLRGFNRAANNRVLVLVDGRSVLNGFFDFVTWEAIPIVLEDVDRIEIVSGPASSIYGANAVLGVINIITKKPEQLAGVRLNAWYGERDTLFVNQQVGARSKDLSYKLTASHRSGAGFTAPARRAGETASFNSEVTRPVGSGEATISGGIVRHDIETTGEPAAVRNSGITGFLRGDYRQGRFQSRVFWNAGRGKFTSLAPLGDPSVHYDTVDALAAHGLGLPAGHDLVFGVQLRLNSARSSLFQQGPVRQHLGGVFLEDDWSPIDGLRLLAGGRMDHHPRTGWMISPRGGLVWEPAAGHVFRVLGGASYRNPTLVENELQVLVSAPTAQTSFVGDHELLPERLRSMEAGYSAELGRLRATVAIYRHQLRDQIVFGSRVLSAGPPPSVEVRPDNAGRTRALGAESGLELQLTRPLSAFGTYTYQYLEDIPSSLGAAPSAPKHKANAGLRLRQGGWTATVWTHWQSRTVWSGQTVADYALLNVWAGYAFAAGLELGLSAFNATDTAHYEGVPSIFQGLPSGRGASRVRRRLMAVARWRF